MSLRKSLLWTLALAAIYMGAHFWPLQGGWSVHEPLLFLSLPFLSHALMGKGIRLGWLWLGFFLGFLGCLHWLPRTLEIMGGLPVPLAWLGGVLLCAYEALGPLLALAIARWVMTHRGPFAAALLSALALMAWERGAFHVYPFNWGAPFGGVPALAKGAAFLGAMGLAGMVWFLMAWSALQWVAGRRGPRVWLPLASVPLVFAALAGGWHLLPRGDRLVLDLVMVQPNHPPGQPFPGMEADGWALTDEAMAKAGLPKPDAPTLVLWAESSILGWDHRGDVPALREAAQRRGVAWLFGTEGGLMNLVRGEVGGGAPFIQGKVHPMPFGEQMPGPPALRAWIDKQVGRPSQVPGMLSPQASFNVPGVQRTIRVHPVICSEALLPFRVLEGLTLAGGDLITNHTNDGWFEGSRATDLHAAQIRLRATETGLPLVRATLTGRSGLFREDGSWELWDGPQTRTAYTRRLSWNPVLTPWRQPAYRASLMGVLLALAGAALYWPRRQEEAKPAGNEASGSDDEVTP